MARQRVLLMVILTLVAAAIFAIVALPPKLGLDLQGGSQITIQVKPTEEIKDISENDLEAVRKVIEERVNVLGVSEALVQTSGKDQILVQLPGVKDPEQATQVIGVTAQLDFRLQNAANEAVLDVRQKELAALTQQQADLEQKGDKAGLEALKPKLAEKQQQFDQASKGLFDKTELSGKYLKDAIAGTQNNQWEVLITFDDKGAKLFADLTKKAAATQSRLGIFLDDKLVSAPGVGPQYAKEGITGGQASISGSFDAKSARNLELQLRGGSLLLPIQIVENRIIGATLGKDSVQSSIYAGIGGLTLVLAFMFWYYRLPGLIADIALLIYAVLNFAAFSLLPDFALTLPGIAGFILSIGMAVDANVLIFERTREELQAGKTLYRAVEAGFYRAFSSILDSNVTTLIACGALYFLGSGLVKGFAVTLAVGVAISMFTALTCSRTLLMYAVSIPSLRKLEYYAPKLAAAQGAAQGAAPSSTVEP
jgi:preprotein translocase subunit SecD